MRNTISRFASSFAALLFDQDKRVDIGGRLEIIRSAMFGALRDMPETESSQIAWCSIASADQVQTLWYLRVEMLRLLADYWGEPVARAKLVELTALFEGVVPPSQLRGQGQGQGPKRIGR
jgi:hypothetical protein